MNRELLEEAAEWIKGILDVYSDDLGAGVYNLGSEIATRINSTLSAPQPDAMEVLRRVREISSLDRVDGADGGPDSLVVVFTASDTEAASLIESFGKRVPRAMLEELWDMVKVSELASGGSSYAKVIIDAVADKHGVKVEDKE